MLRKPLMIAAITAPKYMVAVPPDTVGMFTGSALARSSALNSAPSAGFRTLPTIAVTMPVNAAPITTATARSMTLPRRMNSLKPFSTTCS